MLFSKKKKNIFPTAVLLLMISSFVSAQDNVNDLEFGQPPASDSDVFRTLQSLVKVQGTGGPCQEGLYLLTHFGDRENIFQKENRSMIDNPLVKQTWRYCSVFSTTAENSVIMGRNWDNENVGSIIISLYQPPGRYSSVSFSRAIDLGFPLHIDLEEIKSSDLGNRLLLAPFYAMDGMNEHGLSVGVAANKQTTLKSRSNKEPVFITFLIRKILDQTKTIEEAVNLVNRFTPFLLDTSSFAGHLLIVDSSGRSVILEYDQDQWRKTYGDKAWQVLSTKPIYNVSDSTLRDQCWRYRGMSETLENAVGGVDWKAGMKILQDVSQKGTTWSVVYSPTVRGLYFSVYQQWDKVYHLSLP